ncbi:MAG TPA: DUF4838 domain-containing protein [Caldilineaceae bacterium]|nr:DUF4838 domain-containing protein [Caldilineaceae bacterium]
MLLASHGASDYRILLSDQASPSEHYAAAQLQETLKSICGAALPIETVQQHDLAHAEPRQKAIIVGEGPLLEQLGINLAGYMLGSEGFLIKTVGETLVIAGGRQRGTMYGVFSFLEDYLGCRWYTPQASYLPYRETIELPDIEDVQRPRLECREVHWNPPMDGDWAARRKLNGHFIDLKPHHGGQVKWARFVHTFNLLVPPSEYFDSHPEYFSEVKGERTAYQSQLCLTNPDVLRISIERVKQWLRDDPAANVVSVSQNDWYSPCECVSCRAIDEREGSHSGSVLYFVNQVAEAIEAEFPHAAICTLAYQYTRKPPKTIRPRPNVIIRLCSIECCFSHPQEQCPRNRSFVEDIEAWSKICDRIYVWDYVTEFGHYQSPFPNLYSLQPNLRFFLRYGVKGLFEQGPGTTGELAELRSYLIAKLLWNPDIDVDATIDDFLQGYYGQASAPFLRAYIDLINTRARDGDFHFHIWTPLNKRFFTPALVQEATALLRQAETHAENETYRRRIELAQLPIDYVKIVLGQTQGEERRWLISRFFKVAEREGIREIREGSPMAEFRKNIATIFNESDSFVSSHEYDNLA